MILTRSAVVAEWFFGASPIGRAVMLIILKPGGVVRAHFTAGSFVLVTVTSRPALNNLRLCLGATGRSIQTVALCKKSERIGDHVCRHSCGQGRIAMTIAARELTRPYRATCRATGTTCRPNVRSGSIDAVPAWMVWAGIVAASFGIAVIGVTW